MMKLRDRLAYEAAYRSDANYPSLSTLLNQAVSALDAGEARARELEAAVARVEDVVREMATDCETTKPEWEFVEKLRAALAASPQPATPVPGDSADLARRSCMQLLDELARKRRDPELLKMFWDEACLYHGRFDTPLPDDLAAPATPPVGQAGVQQAPPKKPKEYRAPFCERCGNVSPHIDADAWADWTRCTCPEQPPESPQLMQLTPTPIGPLCLDCNGRGEHRPGCPDLEPKAEERTFDELLDASSLGTPEAKAIRAQADPALVAAVLKRADDLAAERQCLMPPPGWTCSRGAGHDGPCAASPTAEPKEEERGGADDGGVRRCLSCGVHLSPGTHAGYDWSCWQKIGDGGAQAAHQEGCLRRWNASGQCSCIERGDASAGR